MNNALEQAFKTLNEEQQPAVSATSGALLVCAGAGSGKTRIIITRIAYLIMQGVAPEHILAVTFTNKAASEMKERLAHLLPEDVAMPYIGTFHGFCLYLLKRYQAILGIDDFSLMDETDQRRLMHGILKRSGMEKTYRPRDVISYISQKKNQRSASSACHDTLEELASAYEREKAAARCYDFDDLLANTVWHLRHHTDFRRQLQRVYTHILVDEYQDTNYIQHELLTHLARYEGKLQATSVCIVGDEDQSIYTWRGATVENFTAFESDFPETSRMTITRNYRSVQPILTAANTLIQHNSHRHEKHLWSTQSGSDRILSLRCASHIQEGLVIARAAQQLLAQEKQPAVLYRSHHQSRALEEAFIQRNIAYTIVGGTTFYQRQEIKDILAYLKLVCNPYDHISWQRACNVPARSLGEKFREHFLTTWRTHPDMDHVKLAQQLRNDVTPAKQKALDQFISVFSNLSGDQYAHVVCNEIIERTGYVSYLRQTYEEDEAREKIENVQELQRAFTARSEATCAQILADITLMHAQREAHDHQQHVLLMTMHGAKGLEFDTVLIPGLEEHVFPSSHARSDDTRLEEERRLCYVGITRARERVILTYARWRSTFGTMNDNAPSRFLAELPQSVTRCEDVSYAHEAEIASYLKRWFTTVAPEVTSSCNDQHLHSTYGAQQWPNPTKKTPWKRGACVWHKRFGTGTICYATYKSDNHTLLTIRFKHGIKRLDARYVTCR